MPATPVVDDRLAGDAKSARDLGCIDEIVDIHLAPHGHNLPRPSDSGWMPVAFLESQMLDCDSRNAVAPAVRKHPGAWPEPLERCRHGSS